MVFPSMFFARCRASRGWLLNWPRNFGYLVSCSNIACSFLMHQIPWWSSWDCSCHPSRSKSQLSLGVAEYNGLAMRPVKNIRPLLPRKGGSRSICSRVPSKIAQVETQVGPGRQRTSRWKEKRRVTQTHQTHQTWKKANKFNSVNVTVALLSNFRCCTFTKTSCRWY